MATRASMHDAVISHMAFASYGINIAVTSDSLTKIFSHAFSDDVDAINRMQYNYLSM